MEGWSQLQQKIAELDGRNIKKQDYRHSLDFHGYELLLLRRLQSDPVICIEWREKLRQKILDEDYDFGEIPHSLWYLAVTLDRKKDRFLAFVKDQVNQTDSPRLTYRETMLTRYMNRNLFTELHLDSIFKYGDDNTLPQEIFKCPSVKWLSMKYNYLDRIPPDIGRMTNLEYLALTNNKLQNKSIPYTLTFCSRLKHLMLDNNLLDALPGFLLKMAALETVHRHGNHNYFKSTFMWYHTDVNERILQISGTNDFLPREPEMLQFWAARAVIGCKLDFFFEDCVAPVLKDYIAEIYPLFNVCGHCNRAQLSNLPGYKVITFKNPYLGNTCVPFQHWACSHNCAMAIEIPARHEQIAAARNLDHKYDRYIHECQEAYHSSFASTNCRRLGIFGRPRPPSIMSQTSSQPEIGAPVMEEPEEFAVPASVVMPRARHRPAIPCIGRTQCHCVIL